MQSCNKSYQRKLDEKLSKRFLIDIDFVPMITISSF